MAPVSTQMKSYSTTISKLLKGAVTACTPRIVQPNVFKFVVCNPCQSSPSLIILVPILFICSELNKSNVV